jgi:hypothetical protein
VESNKPAGLANMDARRRTSFRSSSARSGGNGPRRVVRRPQDDPEFLRLIIRTRIRTLGVEVRVKLEMGVIWTTAWISIHRDRELYHIVFNLIRGKC